ncbi:hypothetical protein Pmani_037257 [Petrolisthes manimaculis]|uniref:Uncharacterized protein n=1 Tax=Petrolisthes manimaculis TaxID=1843537 RepID=A0AAE1NGM2_9EUCA|nr:hypothetical protein Pmani_037257 [Petrolisthes manimaculis]
MQREERLELWKIEVEKNLGDEWEVKEEEEEIFHGPCSKKKRGKKYLRTTDYAKLLIPVLIMSTEPDDSAWKLTT